MPILAAMNNADAWGLAFILVVGGLFFAWLSFMVAYEYSIWDMIGFWVFIAAIVGMIYLLHGWLT